MESLEFTVSLIQQPIRIDKYLSEQENQLSRSRIQQLIEKGNVFLNQQPV